MSPRRTRTQTGLLVFQSALSVVLLVGAALFVQSLLRIRALDLGVDADRVLLVGTLGVDTGAASPFLASLRARADRIPGVESTTVVSGTVPFASSWGVPVTVAGLAERPRIPDGGPYGHAVTPGYFATLGTVIVEGRPLTAADRRGSPLVVVVNETMARLYWPGEPAIGKCLMIGAEAPCSTVVGVARNTRRQEVIEGDSLLYYLPIDQAPAEFDDAGAMLLVRTSTPAMTGPVGAALRREAFALDANLRYARALVLEDLFSPQLRVWRLGAVLFSLFGVLALLVAGAGLYSVVTFDLEGRRREVGLRLALGASPGRVFGFVLSSGLRVALAGILIGAAVAWLTAPLAGDLLYDTAPREWTAFVLAAVSLGTVVVLATLAPAWRARLIDPIATLRE